jgi:hypothetical protein
MEMGRPNSWKRTARACDAPKRKKWFKQTTRRKNRRKARENPESQDKRLDAWAFD